MPGQRSASGNVLTLITKLRALNLNEVEGFFSGHSLTVLSKSPPVETSRSRYRVQHFRLVKNLRPEKLFVDICSYSRPSDTFSYYVVAMDLSPGTLPLIVNLHYRTVNAFQELNSSWDCRYTVQCTVDIGIIFGAHRATFLYY